MRSTFGLLLAVVIQTGVLVAMVAMKQWTLTTGTPVVLETKPVDPRSLFRGDYVRLNYAISNLSVLALQGDQEFERYGTVYVLLRRDAPYWQPVSVHRERPPVPANHVAIKGEVRRFYNKQISARYGIENYFIPEGEGRALERPRRGEKISIVVAVDRFGGAGIKSVLVNGKPRYVEKLF